MTVLHWKSPGAGRSARTQNLPVKGVEHGWLFWQPKWADGGAKKLPLSSQPWPRRVLSPLHSFGQAGLKPRGFVGGAQCLRALQQRLSQCLCSTADQCQAQTSRLCPRCCGRHGLVALMFLLAVRLSGSDTDQLTFVCTDFLPPSSAKTRPGDYWESDTAEPTRVDCITFCSPSCVQRRSLKTLEASKWD